MSGELLTSGADIEQPTSDRWRLRPLHVAARGHGALVRALLAFGASPLATSADGKRASAKAPAGSRAAADLRAAEALWEAPLGPLVSRAALVAAIGRGGRLMRVRELLLRRTSPNSFDRRGVAALHVACACADPTSVGVLLSAGADPNRVARDTSGRRPLHFAAEAGQPRCVRLLLQARAIAEPPPQPPFHSPPSTAPFHSRIPQPHSTARLHRPFYISVHRPFHRLLPPLLSARLVVVRACMRRHVPTRACTTRLSGCRSTTASRPTT